MNIALLDADVGLPGVHNYPLVRKDLFVSKVNRCISFWCVRNDLLEPLKCGQYIMRMKALRIVLADQLLEYASVEPPLWSSTLPHLVIVVVQTLPMLPELLEAVVVDVLESVMASVSTLNSNSIKRLPLTRWQRIL